MIANAASIGCVLIKPVAEGTVIVLNIFSGTTTGNGACAGQNERVKNVGYGRNYS